MKALSPHSDSACFISDGKLALRTFETSDVDLLLRMSNDVEFRQAVNPQPPWPVSRYALEKRLSDGHSAPFTGAHSAIELAVCLGPTVIGIAGVYDIDRVNSVAEIGVSIAVAEHRRAGFGLAAHRLLVDYLFLTMNFRRIIAFAKAGNPAGIAVAKKLGMVEEGRYRKHRWVAGQYQDLVVFGLLREEWIREPIEGSSGTVDKEE